MRGNSPASSSRRTLDSAYAWLMAAVAFLTCFVVFGVVYSFGAFFKPMAAEFGASRAHTSVIFSLTAATYSLLGLVGGRLTDRFGPRRVMLVGALALGSGLVATSAARSLAIAYLTYVWALASVWLAAMCRCWRWSADGFRNAATRRWGSRFPVSELEHSR